MPKAQNQDLKANKHNFQIKISLHNFSWYYNNYFLSLSNYVHRIIKNKPFIFYIL